MRYTLLALLSLIWLFTLPALAQDSNKQAPSTPLPEVVFHTSKGVVTFELFAKKSPKSVANFLSYVREGFYDGTVFHRVINDYIVQGGMYTRQLVAKRTHDPIPAEADNGLSNLRGTIAVARGAGPNSGTSQFFINLKDNRQLDFVSKKSGLTWGYTVFGKVIKGMNVIDAIGKLPTHPQGPFTEDVPMPLVVIEKAEIIQAPSSGQEKKQTTH